MKKDVELYNLTSPQKSIWLTEQFYKGTNVNNICGIIPIFQPINFDKLKIAINKFVENNDSYRIRLAMSGTIVMQYISKYSAFNIDVVNVESEEELENVAKEFSYHSFNLLDNQLFEFKLFKFPDGHGGFIFNTHHIISDSWTTGITINEIISIYYKLLNGENEQSIEKKELSYIDYVQSEKEYINSLKFQKDKEYWNELYKTIPENVTIPSINIDNTKNDTIEAKRIELPVESNLLSKMNDYCSANKVSLFNFIMSIYSIYISSVSNSDDFSIGTPILNRSGFKEKHTAGMFINTLPLRVTLDGINSFKEFVSNIARDSMSLLRHQKYSYQYLIEDLRKKDSSIPSLFNILISYQVTKMTENMEQVPHESNWLFNNCISEDINIHISDFSDNGFLNIAYDYRLNKYTAENMKDMHNRIIHMIGQVLNNNNILLNEIEIVTPEEKEKLLYEFNNTKADYPMKTIAQLFEEQAKKIPNNIAVVFEDEKLTYRELNEKANQLAFYLREKERVEPGTIIGLMVNRSLDMIIGLVGILKCGCTYVPIDPEYPENRIKYMLNDCNAKVLLVNSNTLNLVNNIKNVNIGFDSEIYNQSQKLNINIESNPSDLIYIIYTSGSTGNPKGVMLTNRNIVNYIYGINTVLNFSNNDTIVSVTTMCFDIFVTEIWGRINKRIESCFGK